MCWHIVTDCQRCGKMEPKRFLPNRRHCPNRCGNFDMPYFENGECDACREELRLEGLRLAGQHPGPSRPNIEDPNQGTARTTRAEIQYQQGPGPRPQVPKVNTLGSGSQLLAPLAGAIGLAGGLSAPSMSAAVGGLPAAPASGPLPPLSEGFGHAISRRSSPVQAAGVGHHKRTISPAGSSSAGVPSGRAPPAPPGPVRQQPSQYGGAGRGYGGGSGAGGIGQVATQAPQLPLPGWPVGLPMPPARAQPTSYPDPPIAVANAFYYGAGDHPLAQQLAALNYLEPELWRLWRRADTTFPDRVDRANQVAADLVTRDWPLPRPFETGDAFVTRLLSNGTTMNAQQLHTLFQWRQDNEQKFRAITTQDRYRARDTIRRRKGGRGGPGGGIPPGGGGGRGGGAGGAAGGLIAAGGSGGAGA